jgi:serine/threonine protein kinase
VTELVAGGELFDRIVAKTHYTEKEARDLVKMFLETMMYMHEAGVVHRDLKPENLLLCSETDDSDIKIADFGFAKKTVDLLPSETACGTPGYVAPEILRGTYIKYRYVYDKLEIICMYNCMCIDGFMRIFMFVHFYMNVCKYTCLYVHLGDRYGTEVDIWSMGVICYVLLAGYPPFYDEDQKKLFKKIKEGKYHFHQVRYVLYIYIYVYIYMYIYICITCVYIYVFMYIKIRRNY